MTPRRYDYLKRALDILGAAIGGVLAAPLIAATALVVAATLGRPVLFRQQRPGLGGRIFEILKFRTMLAADPAVGRVTDEDRMTPTGSRIRSLSLDELPSLWNVFKGDMSIVGPRPLMVSYLTRYSARQSRRHEVRPGLTGLAQVSGRNALPWDARLELDVWYVDNRSFRLDLSILLRTVGKVLRRDGITGEGSPTMPDFFGPMSTDRLELVEVPRAHPPTRFEWLSPNETDEVTPPSAASDVQATDSPFGTGHRKLERKDWVALDRSGEPVSACGLTAMTASSADAYLVFSPEQPDCEVGSETMRLLIARAWSLGLQELRVHTDGKDVKAQQLFAELGFRQLAADSRGRVSMMLSRE